VNGRWLRAAGAGRQFAPAALVRRCWAAPSTSPLEASMRMRSFAGALPELAFDLTLELCATGRSDLARELEACTVKSVSYDPETDVGLVALEAQRQLNAVERNVMAKAWPSYPILRRALCFPAT